MNKLNILQHNYLVHPYAVGKDKRSLAMVIPSEIVKALGIDPLSIFLLLKVKGIDDLQIQIIREADLAKKYTKISFLPISLRILISRMVVESNRDESVVMEGKGILENVNDIHDEHISFLFKNARIKLLSIVVNTDQQKKQIVAELAKELEGGGQRSDTICNKIVKQLKDIVSPSFIRECRDEKLQAKLSCTECQTREKKATERTQISNATGAKSRKKKVKKRKEVIVIEVDGRRCPFKKDEGEPSSTTTTDLVYTMTTDRIFDQSPLQPQPQKQHEQQLKSI